MRKELDMTQVRRKQLDMTQVTVKAIRHETSNG